MQIHIETLSDPPVPLQDFLWAQLRQHGLSRLDAAGLEATAFLANVARQGGDIVGGTLGHVFYGGYNLQLLWIREELRGRGLGQRLLEAVEAQARAYACSVIFGFSFGFQAPGFYLKAGYTTIGTIEDYPPGYACHFLSKRLS
jgi:GNAT superfamily N-acetyltransferase